MKRISFIIAVALLLPHHCIANGLTLGATRLIYEAGQKEASVSLRNTVRNTPYLVQSWVSDFDSRNTANVPFITTPPLFKLNAEKESPVRVVYIGKGKSALPGDRESVFLLNVRAIPAAEKKQPSARMTIATQNIIKLIYRPQGLNARAAAAAAEKLQVTVMPGRVTIHNPTPYVVTLANMAVNGKKLSRTGTIRPFSSRDFSVQSGVIRHVSWNIINDWGGLSQTQTVNL